MGAMDKIDYSKEFNSNLDNLIELLKIKSVYDEKSASTSMPFGKGVNDALLFMKSLAIKDGFNVEEYDGYAISIEFGSGTKRIDIASHLDVVAASDEDFNIHIDNNKLYGRGTSDMKVPMFLTYLSLKLLKDKYPNAKSRIRIVLGTDEERTMNDMKYYIDKVGYPDFAFTPDGFFPMGIGEKGAIMWTITSNYGGKIISLNGGSQCNIVSPYAACVVDDNNIDKVCDYIKNNNIDGSAELINNQISIIVKGVAAHASIPFFGHNATIDLLKIIKDLYKDEICENLYSNYADYFGKGFNSFVSDDPMDCLSVNLGILKIDNGKLFGQVDCRYPFSEKATILTERLKKVSKSNVSLDYNDDPTLCKEDDIYVKTMLETYRNITNDYSRPIVSGGVSYSKVFKHCISFGPNTLDKPNLAHQDGEYVDLNDVLIWFRIYYETIEKIVLLGE